MSPARAGAISDGAARTGWTGRALVGALLGLAALGVARTRAPLVSIVHAVKPHDDVVALPPPAELRAMALGYHAAAADVLWAKLLVEYGAHWAERRPFLDVPRYADAILALEPDYAPLYPYIGTLLVYRPPRGTEDDARRARGYLEEGTRVRPTDPRRWAEYGQFVAFIGPSFLPTDSEKALWRRDGAEALARAVDLGGGVDRSLVAASLLGAAGERATAIRYLRRAYALADDDATRAEIVAKLRDLEARAEEEAARERVRPPDDATRCAGRGAPGDCGVRSGGD